MSKGLICKDQKKLLRLQIKLDEHTNFVDNILGAIGIKKKITCNMIDNKVLSKI